MAIEVGQRYGYRQHPLAVGEPLQPVQVVKLGPPKSRKCRIKWLDGEYEGLEQWVTAVRLVVLWSEAEALRRDEQRILAAQGDDDRAYATTEGQAIQEVFRALSTSGKDGIMLGESRPYFSLLIIDSPEDTCLELGLDIHKMLEEPRSFVDRTGVYVAPYAAAQKLAREFCQRFRSRVLNYLRIEENRNKFQALMRYVEEQSSFLSLPRAQEYVDVLIQRGEEFFGDTHRLIRQWCGGDDERTDSQQLQLYETIERLKHLVVLVIKDLKWQRRHQQAAIMQEKLNQVMESFWMSEFGQPTDPFNGK